jgi:hypothetical protein
MMNYFSAQPEIIHKLHLLSDCTSSVAHPEIDFEAMAQQTFAQFAEKGLRLQLSSQPIK